MFGLIDGNSFYCSCERAFDPKLRNKPLIVLSNNDGCAIARTPEAKKLGVKMGAPWHLIKDKPEMKTVVWRSSNYELYGDMSRRMYQVLEDIFPAVEPYSIDEMFLDFRGLTDAYARSHVARDQVRKIAKIPTCVGIGHTKTIAKLANAIAKDEPKFLPKPGEKHVTALFIEVDDFEDVLERLKGYPITMEERTTFYGTREIGVNEPGGHAVVFAKHTGA